MAKIYISPSNQNSNKYSYGNTNEMEQCYKIGTALNTALKRCGFTTKIAQKGQSMTESIKESNNFKCDVHVCIHTNAGGGKGTEVFVYAKSNDNLKYAQPVYDEIVKLTKNGRGIKANSGLAEINSTTAKCVYCECEFHDNVDKAKWIINNTSNIGEAICKGLCKAFNKTYKTKSLSTKNGAKLYRVRKSWNDESSQIGAYNDLDNAKRACDLSNPYSVYDENGKVVYPK